MTEEIDLADIGRLGARLGKGGQATVYSLPELTLNDVNDPVVFKEYFGQQSTPHGLRAIVRIRSSMDDRDRERLDTVAVWPVRVVRHNGIIRGVLMPVIPDSFFQSRMLPMGGQSRDPREVQNLIIAPDRAEHLGMPAMAAADRLAVCRDLAAALAFLHEKGIVFGDVNAKNELYRVRPDPTVMLVDCDAVRIRGSAAVVRQLNAPDWAPPEGSVLTQATDVYKLGLFILRVLTPGPQASVARDPRRLEGILDAEGYKLLIETLGDNGKARPPASAWRHYFARRTPRRGPTVVAPSGLPDGYVPQRTSGWRRDPRTGSWVPAS